MIEQVLEQLISKIADYLTNEENRASLETKLLLPLTKYISVRFAWIVHSVQVIAVLALVQTIILVILLIRSFRSSSL